MSDAAETAATERHPSASKEEIYLKIADYVKEKTGKRIGKTGGHALFDMIVGEVVAAATRDGQFRFNLGFGSMHVKTYQAGSRRLPSGAETTFGERQKLRYEGGVMTAELIKNKGDLTAAMATRGRSPLQPAADPGREEASEPEEAAPAEPAAAPAAASAPTEETAPAAAAPAAGGDDELDLDLD